MKNNLSEKIFLADLYSSAATKATKLNLQFTQWLIAGFGAAISLLFVNLESTLKLIEAGSFKAGIFLFSTAIIVHLIQRYLAGILVETKTSNELGKDQAPFDDDFDFSIVFRDFEKSTFWPVSLYVRKAIKEIEEGDFCAHARRTYRITQMLGFLSLVQVVICISALATLLIKI